MPNGIDQRDIREILKGASVEDLRTMCSAITKYIPNGNPPQLLMLDNPVVNNVLAKYGLIEISQAGSQVINVHPSLGKLETESVPVLGEYRTTFDIQYINPSNMMDKTINESKSQGGPHDTATGYYPVSPFDVITAKATYESIIESTKTFNDMIRAGWEERTLFIRVIRDKNSGEQSLQYWIKDEDASRQQLIEALIQADATGQVVEMPPDQYTIIQRPTGEVPFNGHSDSNALAYRLANKNAGGNLPETFTRSSLSPTAEIASGLASTEALTKDFIENSGKQGKPLEDEYGINSIAKKTAGLAGQWDFENFEAETPRTWGGISHNIKNLGDLIGRGYNYGFGLAFVIRGLAAQQEGDKNKSEEYLKLGGKMIASEAVWSPTTTFISKQIGRAIVPEVEAEIPRGRGSNVFSNDQLDKAKEIADELGDEDAIETLNDIRGGRGVSVQNRELIGNLLGQEERLPKVGKIAIGSQLGVAAVKYGPYILGWDETRTTEENNELRNTAKREVGPNGKPIQQVEIFVQTKGQVEVDTNTIEALNPNTGRIETIDLPNTLVTPSVTVRPENPELEGFDFGRNFNLTSTRPFMQTLTDLSDWDKVKLKAVELADVVTAGEQNYPINLQIQAALETLQAILNASVGAIGGKAAQEALKAGLKKLALGEILKFLAHPLATFCVWVINGGIPGDDPNGSWKRDILKQEHADRIKELDEKCKKRLMTKEDCEKERKNLDDTLEKELKKIKGSLGDNLLSPSQDPYLNSDVSLALEAEVAKNDFRRYQGLMSQLNTIGGMLEQDTCGLPIDLASINQDVSFVIDQNKPPYEENDGGGNSPIPIGCFPSYINIRTPTDYIKISEIKIGDSVVSFDTNGELQEDVVSNIFSYVNKDIYRYYLSNNTTLDVTKEHPVLVKENIFEEIGKLKIGDSLIDIHGNFVEILSIEFLTKDTVYNIEVFNNHTYIANNIRVHNKTINPIGIRPPQKSLALIVSAEFEEYMQEWLDWIEENFPGVLQDGWPLEQEYPEVPGVGGDGEPKGPQEPTDAPEGGIPGGGTEPDTPQEGPVAVGPGTIPNVPLELLFNLPDPILDPVGYADALRKAGVIP